MTFGLSPKSTGLILAALREWEQIEKTYIFGSRAMGNYKNGSDVDLGLYGPHITEDILVRVGAQLNGKLPLPYSFDLVHYQTIDSAELRKHIDREGKVFYVRTSSVKD